MEWFTIIGLVLFGLILIIIEVIFIPGTTIIGIIGLAIAGLGIWQSFASFGTETGLLVLTTSSLFAIASIIYSFKSGVWKRFALNDSNKTKFNEDIKHDLSEGDQGVAVSTLRPIGKAEFNDKVFEVKTNGGYLESGTKIKVIKIQHHVITVEPLEQ